MPDTQTAVIRIAMWSGPRNISTAMMRSWENRGDTSVVDEPFYAAYLNATGIIHPMQKEVLASQSSDWATVVESALNADLSFGETIQYQKHMTQHMVSNIDEDWFASLRHAFLIRSPEEVVASYGVKRDLVTANDLGFAKQKELYDKVVALSDRKPPVIDSRDVLADPKNTLSYLCDGVGVPFDEAMLAWPAGSRDSDGAWAPHWYQNVEKSTGFSPYQNKVINLSKEQQRVADECRPYYEAMCKENGS
jgi:hypothetical protein